MAQALWLNPAVGVSGDMLLGALIDAGAQVGEVRKAIDALGVPGWDLSIDEVDRNGLRCRHARVTTETTDEPRTWSEIDALIAGAALPTSVADGARSTFRRLAQVEAAQHGVAINDVHFHEVGAVDAIVDIVGSWAALGSLGVDAVASGPVGLGAGTVDAAHGTLPNPSPAVLALLEGLPVSGLDVPAETATPTGAALLAKMVDRWGPVPSGRLGRTGYGAGSRDVATHPNLLAAVIVETDGATTVDSVLVETTLDDVTPEILGYVIDRALEAGADDAWLVPVVMKKSRPGHQLRILCTPALREQLIDLVAIETGTLGVRTYRVEKDVFSRRFDQVSLDGRIIRVKVGPHGAKPEAADVIMVADETGRSARSVAADALARWAEGDRREKGT